MNEWIRGMGEKEISGAENKFIHATESTTYIACNCAYMYVRTIYTYTLTDETSIATDENLKSLAMRNDLWPRTRDLFHLFVLRQ